MGSQDQPRGSREAYERLSDPAMYWTQVDAQPIREPIRREPPHAEVPASSADPYRELSPDWKPESNGDETALAELLPYDDEEPAYDDRRTYPVASPRQETYRRGRYDDEPDAQDRFGGVNWGAGFFGWLVTVGFGVFLAVALAVAFVVLRQAVPAVGDMVDSRPGVAAVALAAAALGVVLLAYYTGGYVAGRMSRFDGGRQGAGVWITGILLTALASGLALVFGSSYAVLDRLDLPSVSPPPGATGVVGLAATVVAAVGSLLAAIAGGKVGCRYHRKVDEYL